MLSVGQWRAAERKGRAGLNSEANDRLLIGAAPQSRRRRRADGAEWRTPGSLADIMALGETPKEPRVSDILRKERKSNLLGGGPRYGPFAFATMP
jgi:hypothetical protein